MKHDYKKWLSEKNEEHTEEKERIWKIAQFVLLETLCSELDNEFEQLIDRRYGATGSRAQVAAYISSLRIEYSHKKKL